LPIDYDKSLSQLKSVFKVDEFEAGDKQGEEEIIIFKSNGAEDIVHIR